MKNKLLLSSALVGSMISAGSAIAQTTVSGSLDLHYRAQKHDINAGFNSNEGFGRETQLNIANKGKLNIGGWDYAAGFSLEFDGNTRNPVVGTQTVDAYLTVSSSISSGAAASVSVTGLTAAVTGTVSLAAASTATEANSISNENIFIDFINASSGTTITVGVDHIQNITGSVVPQVIGNTIDNVAVGMGAKSTNTMGANPKESAGFGIIQAIPGAGLTASAWYAPNSGDFGVRDQYNANGAVTGIRNSAYELGVTGANVAGVKGLSLRYFYNKEEASTTALTDIKGKSYGIGYQTGPFGIGAEKHSQNRTSGTATTDADLETKTFGVTYAASQNVTLGLTQLRNDTTGLVKEKITSLQLGYNLGPVAVVAAYSKGDDVGGTAGTDITETAIRLSTKF